MNSKVIKFRNENDVLLPVIVQHLLSLGTNKAANITDEDIEKVRISVSKQEEEAQKEHKILLIGAEEQVVLVRATRDLAKLRLDKETAADADLLIAQNLVSTETYLQEAPERDVQKQYWTTTVIGYIDSLGDEEEKEELYKKIEDEDILEKIVAAVSQDEDIWEHIYESVEYFLNN